jgi:hypothetical protein
MAAGENKLRINEALHTGERLVSKNQQFNLLYQNDGNLCVYDMSLENDQGQPGVPTWCSMTNAHVPGQLVMQPDGNLCIYDNVGHPVICTMTVENNWKGVVLVLQDDGNLVLHGITTLFQTAGHGNGLNAPAAPPLQGPGAAQPVPGGGNNVLGNLTNLMNIAQEAEDAIGLALTLL